MPAALEGFLYSLEPLDSSKAVLGYLAGLGPCPDEIDALRMARVQQDPCRCAPSLDFVGQDGGNERASAGQCVEQDCRAAVQSFRNGHLPGVHRGEDDPVHPTIVHRLNELPLEIRITFGLTGEEQMARSRAASRAPQIKWPANGVVATVSDMKPMFEWCRCGGCARRCWGGSRSFSLLGGPEPRRRLRFAFPRVCP